MKNDSDDKKFSDTVETKIPSRRTKRKNFVNNLRESFKDMLAEISWKYVATVAGVVTACILIIGAVLIFADPDVAHIKKPMAVTEETDGAAHCEAAQQGAP